MIKNALTTIPLTLLIAASAGQARPVEIYGNANGLWSPTHPHLTSDKDKPNSPVLYVPPEPEPITEEPIAQVCPTLNSAPHLCQNLDL